MTQFGKRSEHAKDPSVVVSGFITAVATVWDEEQQSALFVYERAESQRLRRLMTRTMPALPPRAVLKERPSAVNATDPLTLVTPHNGPNKQLSAHSKYALGLEVAA